MMARLMEGPRADLLLIPCRSARLNWPTVESILRNRPVMPSVNEQTLEIAERDYRKLSMETAQRTVRFWQLAQQDREVAGPPDQPLTGSTAPSLRAETDTRSRCSTGDLVSRARMQIKQPRFDSVNAHFSVADVIVELLRTKNVHEASVLRFGSGGALGAARSRIWMSHQFFEETARPRLRSRRNMPIEA